MMLATVTKNSKATKPKTMQEVPGDECFVWEYDDEKHEESCAE
jgi:hypothetical protein